MKYKVPLIVFSLAALLGACAVPDSGYVQDCNAGGRITVVEYTGVFSRASIDKAREEAEQEKKDCLALRNK